MASPVSESICFAWLSVNGLTKPVMNSAREAASLDGGARLGVPASCTQHETRLRQTGGARLAGRDGMQDADAAKGCNAVPACPYTCSGLASEHPEGCAHINRQVICPRRCQRHIVPGGFSCQGRLLWTEIAPWQPRHAASQRQSASRTDCRIS